MWKAQATKHVFLWFEWVPNKYISWFIKLRRFWGLESNLHIFSHTISKPTLRWIATCDDLLHVCAMAGRDCAFCEIQFRGICWISNAAWSEWILHHGLPMWAQRQSMSNRANKPTNRTYCTSMITLNSLKNLSLIKWGGGHGEVQMQGINFTIVFSPRVNWCCLMEWSRQAGWKQK